MVRIEAGCFDIGSPDGEEGRDVNERQHRVCIENAFRLGKTEVTVAQFSRFVEATGYATDAQKHKGSNEGCNVYDADDDEEWDYRDWASWRKPNKYQGNRDNHPVACVSWNDVMAYIAWLNDQTTEKGYRLPTESEWEYAARAESQDAYFWSNGIDDQACRYANGADKGIWGESNFPCDDGHKWVSPVATYRPNNWGLNDMLGNLWEWTFSDYQEDHGGAEKVCVGENSAARCVIRGGGWTTHPRRLRSATRSWQYPGSRSGDMGFRLAQDL
jgi:serine/threonine-protein kinase PpkA